MYRFIKIFIFLPLIFGCSFSNSRKKHSTIGVSCVSENKIIGTRNEIVSSVNVVDFFGMGLSGEYSDVISKIYQLPVLTCLEQCDSVRRESNDVMYFSHIVEFCGVPCCMNARYRINSEDEISVHDLCFITSQTDGNIIHMFVSELKKYYGEPDIYDESEDRYHWYLPNGLSVRARHLHAPEGGWTIFFYY